MVFKLEETKEQCPSNCKDGCCLLDFGIDDVILAEGVPVGIIRYLTGVLDRASMHYLSISFADLSFSQAYEVILALYEDAQPGYNCTREMFYWLETIHTSPAWGM